MDYIKKELLKINYLLENKGHRDFNSYLQQHNKVINEYRYLTFSTLSDNNINEYAGTPPANEVIQMIRNNEFDIDNNEEFSKALYKGDKSAFLTQYTASDFANMTTYKVKGLDIGYAIKSDGDIVSVFNNSGVKGIGTELMKSAIRNGGTKLDHFDGYLSKLYEPLGFKEIGRDNWDDQYAPDNWDYEKYGRPDVVYRKVA